MFNKYPYTDFHELNLDWVLEKIKELTEKWANLDGKVKDLNTHFDDLKKYVQDFFEMPFRELVNDKLDEMLENGQLATIIYGAYAIRVYNTVADMCSDLALLDGHNAMTLGYHSLNDGGGATYKISDTSDLFYEELDNALFANLIHEDEVNIRQLGAYGDNTHDDTLIIQDAVNKYENIFIPAGQYKTTSPINMKSNRSIRGVGNNKSQFMNSVVGGTFRIEDPVSNVRFSHIEIETSNYANGWAFYLENASRVVIEYVNILGGSFNNTLSGCIRQSGDTWQTLLVNHCIFDSGGNNNWAVSLVNTAGSRRIVDCHFDDVFLDYFVNPGINYGCMRVVKCEDVNLTNCLFRTHDPATCVRVENGTVVSQSSSMQASGLRCVIVVQEGVYASRNSSENSIINMGTVNRFVDGIFNINVSPEFFDTTITGNRYGYTRDVSGRFNIITSGSTTGFETDLLLVEKSNFNNMVLKFQSSFTMGDHCGIGLVLYNANTRKMRAWTNVVIPRTITSDEMQTTALAVHDYDLNVKPETYTGTNNFFIPVNEMVRTLRISYDGASMSYGVGAKDDGTFRTVFANQPVPAFTHVGIILTNSTLRNTDTILAAIDSFYTN